MNKKSIFIIVFILIVVAVGLLVVAKLRKPSPVPVGPSAPIVVSPVHKVIGRSVEGRAIDAYTYEGRATGDASANSAAKKHVVFVGGIHGGYEWNSVLLAYKFMDYLALPENSSVGASIIPPIPPNLTVTVIPSANPDGVFKIIGKEGRFTLADVPKISREATALGRFNAHGVDLNRNFDCKWKPQSMWQSKTVSAGIAAFSEPEAVAIRDFVLSGATGQAAGAVAKPSAVIFWHSQANAVYASECEAGILPETRSIMNAYSKASGYAAVDTFDSYAITGDAEGWLASIGIPAITVELETHETIEWERNLAGIKAVLGYFAR